MKILKVPYAQKDQAKALGARWNNERKTWYVPDGQPTAPFEQWIAPGQDGSVIPGGSGKTAKPRVDSHASEPVVGALYVELEHACDPFSVCPHCAPLLEKSGWEAAHMASLAMLRALKGGRC
jgi:hypothetical protein